MTSIDETASFLIWHPARGRCMHVHFGSNGFEKFFFFFCFLRKDLKISYKHKIPSFFNF